jgi:hypothetical protein
MCTLRGLDPDYTNALARLADRQYIEDTAKQHELLMEMRRKGEIPARGEAAPAPAMQ